jgi:phage shock protein E
LIAAAAVALAACGEGDAERAEQAPRPASAAVVLLPPADFATALRTEGTIAVNVHIRDEGSIPGTLAIPYDRIRAHRDELPPPAMRIAVYCMTGRMSAIAARTLAGVGYRTVVELEGGMEA